MQRLYGEFAIVLVDMHPTSVGTGAADLAAGAAAGRVLLATDAFSTKPLWYATWTDQSGKPRFLAASYESAL